MRKLYFYYLILFCCTSIGIYGIAIHERTSFSPSIQKSSTPFQKSSSSDSGNCAGHAWEIVLSYTIFSLSDSTPIGHFPANGPLFLLLFSRPLFSIKLSPQKSKLKLNFNHLQDTIRRKGRSAWIYIVSVTFLLLFYAFTLFLINRSSQGLAFPGLVFVQIALSVNLLIIIIGLTYLYRVEEKKQKLSQLKTQRQQRKLYEIQQLQQRESIKLLRLQNELQVQRERLARDLHDGIGSQLTHIVTKLDMLSIRSAQARQLGILSDFARETNQILRETIWVLNHNAIEYTQFQQRMSGFLNRLWEDREQPELKISMSEPSTLLISPVVAMTIFRIGQEVINNALKYANADSIEILFRQRANTIVVEIGDNGIGFDLQKVKRGYGLDNIQKRCSELGGQLMLYSGLNGTAVILELPPSEAKSV